VAGDRAWRGRVAAAASAAFGHRRIDVQRDALDDIGRWWPDTDDDQRKVITTAADALGPSLLAQAAALFGTSLVLDASEAASVVTIAEVAFPGPFDDGELVQAVAAAYGDRISAIEFERLIEAMLRVADRPREELSKLLAPVMRRPKTSSDWGFGGWAAAFVRALTDDRRAVGSDHPLGEVIWLLRKGHAIPHVAMPERTDGSISTATAEDRLRGTRLLPGAALFQLTRWRADDARERLLDLEVTWVCEPPLPGYPPITGLFYRPTCADHHLRSTQAKTRYPGLGLTCDEDVSSAHDASQPHADSIFRSMRQFGDGDFLWSVTAFPHHLDVLIACEGVLWQVDDGRSSYRGGRRLSQLMHALLDPNVRPSSLVPHAIALGLGARATDVRSAAIDAVASLVERSVITAASVGKEVGRLCTAGIVKPLRIHDALVQCRATSPAAARDVALAAAPLMTGVKGASRVLGTVVDAAALAGPVPAPEELAVLATTTHGALAHELRRVLGVLLEPTR
jgi:hypothetical protein